VNADIIKKKNAARRNANVAIPRPQVHEGKTLKREEKKNPEEQFWLYIAPALGRAFEKGIKKRKRDSDRKAPRGMAFSASDGKEGNEKRGRLVKSMKIKKK